MWHKPCRTFHPWCPCIKTRCLYVMFTTSQTHFACQPCTQYVSSYAMLPTSQNHFTCQTMHTVCIIILMFMTSQTHFACQPCTRYVSSYVMLPTSQTHFACQTMHTVCIIICNNYNITDSLCMSTMQTLCIIIWGRNAYIYIYICTIFHALYQFTQWQTHRSCFKEH